MPVDPHELSVKEVAELMAMTDMIEEWLHAVRGIVLLHLQRGRKVPGWKLVYGRTQRQWRDARAVAKALLAMGFKPDQIAPRSLLGVPGVEALLKEAGKMQGKGKARTMPKPIARLVQRTVPAMHVAPIDDPRPPVQRGQEFKER